MAKMTTTDAVHMQERPAGSSSHFRQLANLITVADICSPFIATISSDRSVGEVYNEWSVDCFERGLDPMAQIALVEVEGKLQGWIGYDMLEAGRAIHECMEPITADAILTADTCLVDVVAAFHHSSQYFFLVLKGNHFIGWCSYSDLHKPPLRLCLFAMLINVEKLLLQVVLLSPRESVALLSQGRLSKAKDVYALRRYDYDKEGRPYDAKLLECTTIADKIFVARKLPDIKQAIHSLADAKFCSRVERLRNEVAHPGLEERSSSLLDRKKLWPFTEQTETLESELQEFLEQGRPTVE